MRALASPAFPVDDSRRRNMYRTGRRSNSANTSIKRADTIAIVLGQPHLSVVCIRRSVEGKQLGGVSPMVGVPRHWPVSLRVAAKKLLRI